jgi:hypothetical protein
MLLAYQITILDVKALPLPDITMTFESNAIHINITNSEVHLSFQE